MVFLTTTREYARLRNLAYSHNRRKDHTDTFSRPGNDHQNQSNKTGFIPVLREIFLLRCINKNTF